MAWDFDEVEFIRMNAGHVKDEDLLAMLVRITGRSITLGALRRKRLRMGVKKKRGRGRCGLDFGGSDFRA